MPWHPLRRLIVPVVLLIAAAVFRERAPPLSPVYVQLLDWLPYITLGISMGLCAFFNRSRPFTAALSLITVYWIIRMELQVSLADPRAFLVFSLLGIAFPLATLLLVFVPERGLRNRYGAVLVAVVPLLVLAGAWTANAPDGPPAMAIRAWMPVRMFPDYVLSLWASAAFLGAGAASLWMLMRRNTEDAAALFAALLFGFVTLALFDRPRISAVMLGAAGLSLIMSLVRSSYDMAFRDELTGLLGRRALADRLKELGGHYVIAMLDVDHFKKFNDTWGHDVGDDVLKMVAQRIDRVGGGGTAYRYGGEEFAIVFAGKDVKECEPHLQAVRRAVGRYRLALRDLKGRKISKEEAAARRGRRKQPRAAKSVSVTVSIGVAERDEQRAKPEDVITAADAALYRAKQKGRNCLSR